MHQGVVTGLTSVKKRSPMGVFKGIKWVALAYIALSPNSSYRGTARVRSLEAGAFLRPALRSFWGLAFSTALSPSPFISTHFPLHTTKGPDWNNFLQIPKDLILPNFVKTGNKLWSVNQGAQKN